MHSAGSWLSQITDALVFALIGVAIGLGQSLKAGEKDVPAIIGRSICTGGLAAAAGMVLIWWPDLPLVGLIGVAAMLASVGTSVLEKLALKYLATRTNP